MNLMALKRRLLSQNNLRDPGLVSRLVGLAHFNRSDTVVDIGAGRGIITAELAKACGGVLAVEIDPDLAALLKEKFAGDSKVVIFNDDIHHFLMPDYPYKVFANLPFHITADVIHKLTYFAPPPEEAYLIVQKEAGEKYAGEPKETFSSVYNKPWFDFAIVHRFKRSDFSPEPEVDSVLLKIVTKSAPLVAFNDEIIWGKFLKYAFVHGKDLKSSLQHVFTYEQWKRLARDNGFGLHSRASDLKFSQWLALFRFLISGVDPSKYRVFM